MHKLLDIKSIAPATAPTVPAAQIEEMAQLIAALGDTVNPIVVKTTGIVDFEERYETVARGDVLYAAYRAMEINPAIERITAIIVTDATEAIVLKQLGW